MTHPRLFWDKAQPRFPKGTPGHRGGEFMPTGRHALPHLGGGHSIVDEALHPTPPLILPKRGRGRPRRQRYGAQLRPLGSGSALFLAYQPEVFHDERGNVRVEGIPGEAIWNVVFADSPEQIRVAYPDTTKIVFSRFAKPEESPVLGFADTKGMPDWDPARHPRAYSIAALAAGRKGGVWNETKHRRWPAGTPGGLGGKFMDMKSATKLSKITGVPAKDLLLDPGKAIPGRAARGPGTFMPKAPPPLPEIKSPDSPDAIDVHGDVRLAAKLLGEGKAVQLSQVREVSVLLDHLAMLVKDAESKGEKAPSYDLCKVTVKGQNLFCVESKGIPRIKMPQLKGIPQPGSKGDAMSKDDKGEVDLTPDFVKLLKSKGYKISQTTEHAAYLRPSQNELNGKKVAGMVKWMRGGGDPNSGSSLMVSEDNYIIDGHHRWAATVALDSEDGRLGNDKSIPITRVGISTIELLAEAVKFANENGIANAGFGQQPVLPKQGA